MKYGILDMVLCINYVALAIDPFLGPAYCPLWPALRVGMLPGLLHPLRTHLLQLRLGRISLMPHTTAQDSQEGIDSESPRTDQ